MMNKSSIGNKMKFEIIGTFFAVLLLFGCASLKEVTESEIDSNMERNRLIIYDKETKKPFTGILVTKYPDGKIKTKEHYRNGLNHGPYISWYENGQKSCNFNYKGGCRDGKFISWYENGIIKIEAEFKEKATVGHQTMYYSTGEKWSYLSWDKGSKSTKTWDKKGNLIANGTWYKGKKKEGTFTNTDYAFVLIEKYSDGILTSTTDLKGNPIDTTKLKKKTTEELLKEGNLLPLESKFK